MKKSIVVLLVVAIGAYAGWQNRSTCWCGAAPGDQDYPTRRADYPVVYGPSGPSGNASRPQSAAPNIVFILADDMGF